MHASSQKHVLSEVDSKHSWLVFDLESDGEHLFEFACLGRDICLNVQGKDEVCAQLPALGALLAASHVIVGHNIRRWDLPILQGLGLETSAFVWDTLEIELLLNPCRTSYALTSTHHALEDTRLTKDLFFSQLTRLHSDPELTQKLAPFLPKNLNVLLEECRQSQTLHSGEDAAKGFFTDRLHLSKDLVHALLALTEPASASQALKTLLIAPRSLWPILALFLPLSFPLKKDALRFKRLCRERLCASPIHSSLTQAVLERFCECAKTPLASALPPFLTKAEAVSLSEEMLWPYLEPCTGAIDCVDLDALEEQSLLARPYTQIVTLTSPLHASLFKSEIGQPWSFAELVFMGSVLPFAMGATQTIPVSARDLVLFIKASRSEEERLALERAQSTAVARVWLECSPRLSFRLYKNFFYQVCLERFLASFPKARLLSYPVLSTHTKAALRTVFLATAPTKHFDCARLRVNASSVHRSRYWTFQVRFLLKIQAKMPHLPLLYVTDDLEEDEQTALSNYLTTLGCTVRHKALYPERSRRKRQRAVVLTDFSHLLYDLWQLQNDAPFCCVFDTLMLDHRAGPWSPQKAFELNLVRAEECAEMPAPSGSPQAKLSALGEVWRSCADLLVQGGCHALFCLDPSCDEMDAVPEGLFADLEEVPLWAQASDFESDYLLSKDFFSDFSARDADCELEGERLEAAMKLISRMLINGKPWRNDQGLILPFILQKRGDCLVSMPTGGGKSVLFQGPALYRGYFSRKMTLVVSPLRALMQDQVHDLEAKGFGPTVAFINSDLSFAETERIYRRIVSGDLLLLYVTPERFRVRSFMRVLSMRMQSDGGLEYAVFDEAHCIAQWGNDFRPEYHNAYLTCAHFKECGYTLTLSLFSATVTSQEEEEYRQVLPDLVRLGQSREDYNPVRQHIETDFAASRHSLNERLRKVVHFLRSHPFDGRQSRMIVFCRRRDECEDAAEALQAVCENDEGLFRFSSHIGYYHAGLTELERSETYARFKKTERYESEEKERHLNEAEEQSGQPPIYVLFTTKAFGMGMDIPNIHYLMHLNPPSLLEDYLQEVGRAGRSRELYEQAFPVEAESGKRAAIPALCLVSDEDFRKIKELLLKSQLSWSDLSEAKERILAYLQRFSTLEACRTKPLAVPWDVWRPHSRSLDESTASQLVFHWLERAGFLRQRFLAPPHLELCLNSQKSTAHLPKASRSLWRTLRTFALDNGQPSQIPVQEVCRTLRLSQNALLDHLLFLEDQGFVRLTRTISCQLQEQRFGETLYTLRRRDRRFFVLHLIIDLCERYLREEWKAEGVYPIDAEKREELEKAVLNDFDPEDDCFVVEAQRSRKHGEIRTAYLPWKKASEVPNMPRHAVTKVATFTADVQKGCLARLFLVLAYIPGVEIRDERDLMIIHVSTTQWKDFLPELEEDCCTWLSFVQGLDSEQEFSWSHEARRLGLLRHGFTYFSTILTLLRRFGYLLHSPLLPSGVEIFTTETSAEPVHEHPQANTLLFACRQDFDEQERIRKIRLACMHLFSMIAHKTVRASFINAYFQCTGLEAYLSLLSSFLPKTNLSTEEQENFVREISEEALKNAENALNEEQKAIYEAELSRHINVLAGPGSGKTHLLTLRIARLIYREKVDPAQILVLAYNRAVVVELRLRLDALFTRLGLSSCAQKIAVFTFHALARRCLGARLETVPPEAWDNCFLHFLKEESSVMRILFPALKYLLVDEFQDITILRLQVLFTLHRIYPHLRFFTIGDRDQSIYGFDRIASLKKSELSALDYAQFLGPAFYYAQWQHLLKPDNAHLHRNYRSPQAILDFAARYLPPDRSVPISALEAESPEKARKAVREEMVPHPSDTQWITRLEELMNAARDANRQEGSLRTSLAVLFRTNQEVLKGLASARKRLGADVHIRIQGGTCQELWRKREFFEFLRTLSAPDLLQTELVNDVPDNVPGTPEERKAAFVVSARDVYARIQYAKKSRQGLWDGHCLELLSALVQAYFESVRADEGRHTVQDLKDFLLDLTTTDDAGQLYKLQEHYQPPTDTVSVTFTTMHKIKGLAFDAVLIIPSEAPLPLVSHPWEKGHVNGESALKACRQALLADLEEEKRLFYVACTRARKQLIVCTGPREQALLRNQRYRSPRSAEIRYYEQNPGLDKYNLNYNATNNWKNNARIRDLPLYTPAVIKKTKHTGYFTYDIYACGFSIGQLSLRNSSIVEALRRTPEVSQLVGFFVSDVLAWTYEETLSFDKKNGSSFAARWHEGARKQGAIYIPILSGVGEALSVSGLRK